MCLEIFKGLPSEGQFGFIDRGLLGAQVLCVGTGGVMKAMGSSLQKLGFTQCL